MSNKKFAIFLFFCVIGFGGFLSLAFVSAWSEPTGAPPTYNVEAPINIGSLSQVKKGSLGLMSANPGTDYGLSVNKASTGAIKTLNTSNNAEASLNKTTSGVYVSASPASYMGIYSNTVGENSKSGYFSNGSLAGFGLYVLSSNIGGYVSATKTALLLNSAEIGINLVTKKGGIISELKNSRLQTINQAKLSFLNEDNQSVSFLAENFDPASLESTSKVELGLPGIGANISGNDLALNVSGNSTLNGDVVINGFLSVKNGCSGCSVGDLAESFKIKNEIDSGAIVAMDENLTLFKADKNENRVVGVISTNPALDLNKIDGQPLALSGVVPVSVSNENGKINAGDFIMASSVAGVGAKACGQGTAVGKALEGFSSKFGKIKMIVSLSYYNGAPCKK